MLKIIIPGRPCPKKNNPRVFCPRNCRGGRRPIFMQSETYCDYEKLALKHLLQYGNLEPFTGLINVQAHYYLPNQRWWPDLAGLIQATGDILQKAGIITNDRNIKRFDGSEIIGVDKDAPRTEITITEFKGA